MKSKSIIYMLFAFLCFTSYHANGSKINLPNIKSHDFTLLKFDGTPDVWVMVKEENGIKVFLMETAMNGVYQLRVKFENTTNQLINFQWSLSKKSTSLFKGITNAIKPVSFIEKEDKLMVPINNEESLKDFSITINIK